MAIRVGGGTGTIDGGKSVPLGSGLPDTELGRTGPDGVTGLQPTTGLSDPVPVAWGLVRVAGKPVLMHLPAYDGAQDESMPLVWTRNQGAGPAYVQRTREPCASVAYAIVEGPIGGVTRLWTTRINGEISPANWYLLCGDSTEGQNPLEIEEGDSAVPWAEIPWDSYNLGTGPAFWRTAYARAKWLALEDGKPPTMSFEVKGRCASTAGPAHPADVLHDILVTLGPLNTAQVQTDVGPDGNAASSFRTYCTAMGFTVSRAVTDRTTIRELVESLLLCTNATCVWSEGKLKFIPLGDRPIPEEGAPVYQPATIAYELDDDEIIREGHTVEGERVPESQTRNCWPCEIRNAEADYEVGAYEWPHPTDPEKTLNGKPKGLRRADPTSLPWVTSPAHALKISELMCKRSLTIRNRYTLKLNGARWCLLEPGDVIALTHAKMGLDAVLCRIRSIEQDGPVKWVVSVEETPEGSATAVDVTPQGHDGFSTEAYIPSNRPIDGTPATFAFLTNEAHNLPADALGAVTAYDGATTEMHVVTGKTDYSLLWTYSKQDSAGVTSSLTGNAVTVTEMDAGVDSGFVDITATLEAGAELPAELPVLLVGASFTRRFSLAKAKRGLPGTSGEGGTRGPIERFITIAGSTWDSAAATAEILAYGGGIQVLGDKVTETNGAGWSETRAWFGEGSGWLTFVQYVHGNMLITETVGANKFTGNALETTNYAEDVNGNPTAGAKLDHQGTALKVAAGNLQVGSAFWSERLRYVGAVTISDASTSATFTLSDWSDGDTLVLAALPSGSNGTVDPGAFTVKRVYGSLSQSVGGRIRWTQGTIEVLAAPGPGTSVTFSIVILRLGS